jgi:hypothetical protein
MRLSALNPAVAGAGASHGRHQPPPPGGFGPTGPAIAFPIRDRGRVLSHRRGRLLAGAASLVLFGVGTAVAAAADVQPAAVPSGTATNAFSTGGTQAVTTSVPLHDPAFNAMSAAFVP